VTQMEDADAAGLDNDSNTDAAPSQAPPSSPRQSTQFGTAYQASVPFVTPPPDSTPLPSVPVVPVVPGAPVPVPAPSPAPAPAPAPVGAGFAVSLSHNLFAALASPTQMFNPATHSTTEQAETVDSDSTLSLQQVRVAHPL
jgi:hypothetical protein